MSDNFETQETPLTRIDELKEDLFDLQIDYIWMSRDRDGYLGLPHIKTDIIKTAKELLAAGGKIIIDGSFEFVAKNIDKGFINQLKSMGNDKKLTEDENTVTLQVTQQPPPVSEREKENYMDKGGYVPTESDRAFVMAIEALMPLKNKARSADQLAHWTERQGGTDALLLRKEATAKKAGYVQGVCECVAAMFGNKYMGKKLLSEMQVTKEMAKKYANPETYKTLEEGIFAPIQEQQQSRGRGM